MLATSQGKNYEKRIERLTVLQADGKTSAKGLDAVRERMAKRAAKELKVLGSPCLPHPRAPRAPVPSAR